jgi:Spy/CpxP family protein refolding chaperone
MTNRLYRIIPAALLAAGLAFAQNPAPGAGRQLRPGARILPRLVRQLDLTDDQKAKAREIFKAQAEAARPLAQQMREARLQLAKDVKTGATEDMIARDAAAVGNLTTQLTVIRTKAMQQFYGILTPEQKAKWDELGERARQRQERLRQRVGQR